MHIMAVYGLFVLRHFSYYFYLGYKGPHAVEFDPSKMVEHIFQSGFQIFGLFNLQLRHV